MRDMSDSERRELLTDLDEMLMWAMRIGGRYMGLDRASSRAR
jgi:hypothetical protein